ncbi:hypothetical protein DesfrDRAFT_2145 [Solidesulfovibrio fructosivorans JJ]]|uniref:Transmembrane protein n=1 Tax=Solidesulfovibrio fructosivorans JJ] TaxID=596151 RepID=E1JWZ6_SOLFR|nr:magnetosome protein MamC [Solidesulfovibrio fructosivorans]EFL51200.1 hypothetical protein DesfrDRAFT_2145 [Solidesulfovibrio fructosivorans JJ]]
MYPTQYNQNYPSQQRLTNLPVGAVATMGLVGGLLGGIVTAARDMREVRAGSMARAEVAGDVLKEAVGTGLATAVGTAAGGLVFRNGALALATMAAVGIGTKYLYDGLVSAAKDAKKTAAAPVKVTNKKA